MSALFLGIQDDCLSYCDEESAGAMLRPLFASGEASDGLLKDSALNPSGQQQGSESVYHAEIGDLFRRVWFGAESA